MEDEGSDIDARDDLLIDQGLLELVGRLGAVALVGELLHLGHLSREGLVLLLRRSRRSCSLLLLLLLLELLLTLLLLQLLGGCRCGLLAGQSCCSLSLKDDQQITFSFSCRRKEFLGVKRYKSCLRIWI